MHFVCRSLNTRDDFLEQCKFRSSWNYSLLKLTVCGVVPLDFFRPHAGWCLLIIQTETFFLFSGAFDCSFVLSFSYLLCVCSFLSFLRL
jgi:hypothetical protein